MVTSTAVTAFHCATPTLSQIEDDVLHGCHFGRGLMLVIGAPGSGRSHFARRIKNALAEQLPTALIEAHPMISSQQVDHSALNQFGLTQLALQQKTLSIAISEASPGRRVLIMDDAQDLAIHVLKDILEAVGSEWEREDPRLCVLLIGDEMLEASLAELDLPSVLAEDIQRFHMPPFSLDDVQRLATVWAVSLAEQEPELEHIRTAWQKSYGRPGAFLQLLQARENTMSEIQEDEPIISDVVQHHSKTSYSLAAKYAWLKLPLIFLGVFLLALILLYQNEFNQWISEEGATSLDTAAATVESTRQNMAIEPSKMDDATAPSSLEIVDETVPSDSAEAFYATENASVESKTHTPEPLAESVVPKTAPIAAVAMAAKEPTVAGKEGPSTTQSARLSAEEQQLLAAPATAYVVQIIGLIDDKAMKAFEQKYDLSKGLRYRSLRNGKPWQILVQGPYESRQLAESARDRLPEALRKQGPWIKSIKVVQEEIRTANGTR